MPIDAVQICSKNPERSWTRENEFGDLVINLSRVTVRFSSTNFVPEKPPSKWKKTCWYEILEFNWWLQMPRAFWLWKVTGPEIHRNLVDRNSTKKEQKLELQMVIFVCTSFVLRSLINYMPICICLGISGIGVTFLEQFDRNQSKEYGLRNYNVVAIRKCQASMKPAPAVSQALLWAALWLPPCSPLPTAHVRKLDLSLSPAPEIHRMVKFREAGRTCKTNEVKP